MACVCVVCSVSFGFHFFCVWPFGWGGCRSGSLYSLLWNHAQETKPFRPPLVYFLPSALSTTIVYTQYEREVIATTSSAGGYSSSQTFLCRSCIRLYIVYRQRSIAIYLSRHALWKRVFPLFPNSLHTAAFSDYMQDLHLVSMVDVLCGDDEITLPLTPKSSLSWENDPQDRAGVRPYCCLLYLCTGNNEFLRTCCKMKILWGIFLLEVELVGNRTGWWTFVSWLHPATSHTT